MGSAGWACTRALDSSGTVWVAGVFGDVGDPTASVKLVAGSMFSLPFVGVTGERRECRVLT